MNMKLVFAAAAISAMASAGQIVDIDATKYGCSQCNSPSNILPGTVLSNIYSPKLQLTLGPGTYTITNNDANGTDYYSAWQFNGGPGNWVWSFVAANDATSTVLMDDYVFPVDTTQSAMSNQTGTTTWDGNTQLSATSTALFTDQLVLSATTTVDFFIDDYFLGDNTGGVSLLISGGSTTAPEPASIALTLAGLGVCIGGAFRKSRR